MSISLETLALAKKYTDNKPSATPEEVEDAVNNYLDENPVTVGTSISTVTRLSEMNVVAFGDSISDVKVNGKWVDPFKALAKCKSFTCYGRGYCCWTFRNDSEYNITDTTNSAIGNNVIWNQFNRMKADIDAGTISKPDLIFILGGTNDALQNKPLGTPSEVFIASEQGEITTLTNLSASIRYVCDSINEAYPDCKIVLGTPLPTGNSANYQKMVNVHDTIIQCADYLGLKYIDQTYNSGITWYREAMANKYLNADKVHLSDLGGTKIARFLIDELVRITLYDSVEVTNSGSGGSGGTGGTGGSGSGGTDVGTKTYLRDSLLGTMTQGIWEDSVMIPDLELPASEFTSFEFNAFATGVAYICLFSREGTSFTTEYVQEVNFTTGTNKVDFKYTSTKPLYFGMKTVTRGFVGMLMRSASSTGQQYTNYWRFGTVASYVPTVGTVLPDLSNTTNSDLALDCLLRAK